MCYLHRRPKAAAKSLARTRTTSVDAPSAARIRKTAWRRLTDSFLDSLAGPDVEPGEAEEAERDEDENQIDH